jgi:tetrahydromethanopterin S-methyltransferase subunit A
VGPDSRIIGSAAPTPYLYNLLPEAIARFRQQIRLVDLLGEGDPGLVRQAVWSCYQERPTAFCDPELFDPGAFTGDPICGSITWRVRQPWYAPRSADEQAAVERLHALMEEIRRKVEEKQRAERESAPAEED